MGEGEGRDLLVERSAALGVEAPEPTFWEWLLLGRPDGAIGASRLARWTARRHERVHGAPATSSHRRKIITPRRQLPRTTNDQAGWLRQDIRRATRRTHAAPRRNAQQRAAVVLFYYEDQPVSEIVDLLGCTESAAKVWLHRARHRLADLLDEKVSDNVS